MAGSLLFNHNGFLCAVEGRRISKKILVKVAHLPTMLLVIGYAFFWLELFVLRLSPPGRTSWSAWGIFGLLSVAVLSAGRKDLSRAFFAVKAWWSGQGRGARFFIAGVSCLFLGMFFIGTMAALLPPHLSQEYDSLNYHITIPRQHLIRGSFAHLPWSVADLYVLPLDFAIAPYSLATFLPNKMVYLFFFLGLLGLSAQLAWRYSQQNMWAPFAVLMAILGAHGIGIQLGIAMFDVIMVYLFLAALDSVLNGDWYLGAVELAFYFWAKAFIPIQCGILAVVLWIVAVLARKNNWTLAGAWQLWTRRDLKRFAGAFMICSLFIGGPFVIKNLYYTGTPLYPFFPGLVSRGIYQDTALWPAVLERGVEVAGVRDDYGQGRGLKKFIEHIWILAVPEEGVNNRFDYPLGLSYLLVLVPFWVVFFENILKRRLEFLGCFCVIFWILWWLGSQQSRFLYLPLILMMILVLSQERFLRKTMFGGLVVALLFSCLSVLRAHKRDLFRDPQAVLREKDKGLLLMSGSVDRSRPVVIDFADVAFADFAVDVRDVDSVFVFKR